MGSFSWYGFRAEDCGIRLASTRSCMKKVPLCISNDLKLRFLCPEDLDEVKELCKQWFPIDYPDAWYQDITSNQKFYALASVYKKKIVGLLVAEFKAYNKLNVEDAGILSPHFQSQTNIGYILTLGVCEEHRRNGVATLLLENLIAHLTSPEWSSCKAVLLHVLTTNSSAVKFYEKRGFRLHSFLPYYYYIKGKSKDGFSYVFYINGGHPPWTILDYVKFGASVVYNLDPCSIPYKFVQGLRGVFRRIVPRVTRVAHATAAVFS